MSGYHIRKEGRNKMEPIVIIALIAAGMIVIVQVVLLFLLPFIVLDIRNNVVKMTRMLVRYTGEETASRPPRKKFKK